MSKERSKYEIMVENFDKIISRVNTDLRNSANWSPRADKEFRLAIEILQGLKKIAAKKAIESEKASKTGTVITLDTHRKIRNYIEKDQ